MGIDIHLSIYFIGHGGMYMVSFTKEMDSMV